MKALRKCACVAVQFVVTAALLFQQCPVQAIALGMERGSDYVEIPASEEDADAADGSVDAPSSGDNPNESAPSTAGKDEAVSGADNAAGTDNTKQNIQSDDDAANSGDDATAPTSDGELVWNRLGTLEWSKDANKNVIMRPADGAESASYDGTVNAAKLFGKDIKTVKMKGKISVTRLLFGDCRELESIDLSDIVISGQSAAYMFYRCRACNPAGCYHCFGPYAAQVH